MKYRFLIAVKVLLCFSCRKENLNDCDKASTVFKTVTADFSYTVQNNVVMFKNISTNAETYQWDFGDGTSSSEKQLNKAYKYSDKPYTVKLTTSRCKNLYQTAISKTIDIKCTTKSPEIEVDKTTICTGEMATLKLKTACAMGSTIKWSTGALTNTITVAMAGKYSAQCVANCTSAISNEIEVKVNPKPSAPVISTLTPKTCEGEKATISATGCTGGTIKWSDGSIGARIEPIIKQNELFTAICILNDCESVKSNNVNITVNPLALIFTEKSTISNNNNWVLNGKIDFNTIGNDGIVADHGFVFVNGNSDPLTISPTNVSKGSKPESSETTYSYEIPNSKGKLFSYRAFVKRCDGKTFYGNLLKTQ